MNDARPLHPGTFWVEVLPADGFADGGIFIQRPAALYPVLGRVGRTFSCTRVKTGDVVRFPPLTYEYVERTDGRIGTLMHEKVCIAVIEGFDEAAIQLTAQAADALRI